ncbi:MAG TPA: TonB family protein [Marivita sp.]|nr:TonB family protein [Marivita sp.]
MIPRSALWKVLAASTAVAAHAALAVTLYAPEDVRTEASQGASEVKIGTGFADLAVGTLKPMPDHTQAAEPVQPIVATQRTPTAAKRVEPPKMATARVTPQLISPSRAASVSASRNAVVAAPTRRAADPEAQAALHPVTTPTAPAPAASVTLNEMNTLDAQDDVAAAPLASKRPLQRSKAFETANARKVQPKPKPTPQATNRGNATRNASAGASSGNRTKTATRQGTSQGTATTQGSAAASNYPGQVWGKLTRVRRPNGRGTAQVRFTIAPNGNIAALSIAASSGNSRFDRAALQIVRRAGPFPQPPKGARRTYTFTVEGR